MPITKIPKKVKEAIIKWGEAEIDFQNSLDRPTCIGNNNDLINGLECDVFNSRLHAKRRIVEWLSTQEK